MPDFDLDGMLDAYGRAMVAAYCSTSPDYTRAEAIKRQIVREFERLRRYSGCQHLIDSTSASR
jgi:hypothetical protein